MTIIENFKFYVKALQYTPVNMFTKSAYNVWKNNAANKRFDELKKVSIRGSKKATVCENPSGCVCNQRVSNGGTVTVWGYCRGGVRVLVVILWAYCGRTVVIM